MFSFWLQNNSDPIPTKEKRTGVVFVMHAAGPYHISCDGQSGGYFVWNDCGLAVNFPSQCSQQQIQVATNTFLPTKNEVYPGVHIVSAIYQFDCNIERFDKMFTLRLQHCVKLQTPEDSHKMCFIIVQDGRSVVKYGNFEVGKSYGTVTLNRFCHVFIAWICELMKTIRIIVLALSGDQDNSSQKVLSDQSNNSGVIAHSVESKMDYGSSQSSSRQQFGTSEAVPPSSVVADFKHATSPPYKYEAMIVLPRDHHSLTSNWSGYYSIYYDYGTLRQVRT